MDNILKISSNSNFPLSFLIETMSALKHSASKIYYPVTNTEYISTRGFIPPMEIIVTLGSAGAFSALYKIICDLLKRHNSKVIILEMNDTKVTLVAHSLKEEKEILEELNMLHEK
ncbi:hypothetical protein KKA15_06655 [Patescibacteria group bacterium]|nr:hypothetical protein [Patescibacteria group bacterium]